MAAPSQSRPGFQARINYYLNELGVGIVYPNVRGSAGYGKTFLTLDNGFKREDSVKDIGAIIEWLQRDPAFDSKKSPSWAAATAATWSSRL